MRARSLLVSVVGPGAFAAAAMAGGRREPGYRPMDEPISALAASGSQAATIMIPGFLTLAAGSLALAKELRGASVAPSPVPAMLGLSGVSLAGAGLARNSDRTCPSRFLGDREYTRSDDLHAGFSMVTFGLWIAIPLVAARRAKDADERYRRWCRWLGWFSFVTLMVGGSMARRPSQRWSGLAQRVALTSALAWYPLAAGWASRGVGEAGGAS